MTCTHGIRSWWLWTTNCYSCLPKPHMLGWADNTYADHTPQMSRIDRMIGLSMLNRFTGLDGLIEKFICPYHKMSPDARKCYLHNLATPCGAAWGVFPLQTAVMICKNEIWNQKPAPTLKLIIKEVKFPKGVTTLESAKIWNKTNARTIAINSRFRFLAVMETTIAHQCAAD